MQTREKVSTVETEREMKVSTAETEQEMKVSTVETEQEIVSVSVRTQDVGLTKLALMDMMSFSEGYR